MQSVKGKESRNENVSSQTLQAWQKLCGKLKALGRVAVAYSGGQDSSLLLYAAKVCLGKENVLALISDTPTIPRSELRFALQFVKQLGVRCKVVRSKEFEDPNYLSNPPDRCYYCKRHLFEECLRAIQEEGGGFVLCDGTNSDDFADFRPGLRAKQEYSVRSPLAEAGLGKKAIIELLDYFDLPAAQKSPSACLASRIPYATPITLERLAAIEKVEEVLKEAGFKTCRARYHGSVVRIEVPKEQVVELVSILVSQPQLVVQIKDAGFKFVTVDVEGYRTGSLNVEVERFQLHPEKNRTTKSS